MPSTLSAEAAEMYLESEIQWDAEPALTGNQQETLLSLADTGGAVYTYRSLAGSIYLGWRWKRAKAVETYSSGEDKIFDHIEKMLEAWAWAAPEGSLSGKSAGSAFAGGISKADIKSREADPDRVGPVFTTDTHWN